MAQTQRRAMSVGSCDKCVMCARSDKCGYGGEDWESTVCRRYTRLEYCNLSVNTLDNTAGRRFVAALLQGVKHINSVHTQSVSCPADTLPLSSA